MAALSARPLTNGKGLDDDGKAVLEHLGVCQSGIRHMRLDCIGAIEALSSPGAATDGFIVLPVRIAKGEIIHGPLGGGHRPQGGVEGIDDTLRGLDITGDHRCRVFRVQHGIVRDQKPDRFEAAGIERDRLVHQRAEDIQYRRPADSCGGIKIIIQLGRCAAEIDGHTTP